MQTRWIDSRAKRILAALAINAVLLAVYMLLYYPCYETSDDSGINAIASGIRGVRDPHLIYTNYYWGLLLTRLFRYAPGIPWTAVLQYVVLFISFTAVACVLMKLLRNTAYLPLIIGLLALYEYDGYIQIQYTKTAGFAAVAGLALIFGELFSRKESYFVILIGLILCWISSMYRFQQFLATVGIFSMLVLYYVLWLTEHKDGKDAYGGNDDAALEQAPKHAAEHNTEGVYVKHKLVIASVAAVMVLGGAFGLLAMDKAHYTSDDWKEYIEYNEIRTEVTDFGLPPFEENEEKYLELGIDETAFHLLHSWNIQDPEKFNMDVYREIAAWKHHPEVNKEFFKSFLKQLYEGLKTKKVFRAFLLIALGWLICGRHGIREFLTLIYGAVVALGLYGYMFYIERFLLHRVDVCIWFAFSVLVLWLYRSDTAKRAIALGLIMLLLVAKWTVTVWDDNWRIHTDDKRAEIAEEKAVIEEMHSDHDHLYLTKVGLVSFHKAYNALEQAPYCMGDNIYGMGGWTAATPVYTSILDSYNVKNPYRDMINSDSVYLVDDKIDLTVDYLRTWYNKNAKAEKVKKIGPYDVYRIVAKKK